MRRGFSAATLDEIAFEAGVTKGAVYSNFAGKADLFMAVFDARKRDRLERYERAMPAVDGIEALARTHVRVMIDDDPEGRWAGALVEAWAASASDEGFRLKLAAGGQAINRIIGVAIERIAERDGIALAYPTERLAQIGAAVVRGLLLQRLHDPRPLSDREIEDAFVAFARGIARRPAGEPQEEEP
jgi:AcrR family transcriptional regulator